MEGRHDFQPIRLRATIGFLACRLKILAVLDQLGAKSTYRAILLDRIAVRNIDRHRHAVTACRKRETLSMIAARRRNDPGRVGPFTLQAVEVDQSTAHLESTGRGMILMFDNDRRTQPLAKQRPGMRRRRRHSLADDLVRAFELPEVKHLNASPHTSALPPAKAAAVASSVASTGNSISLCALPDGIIGKQFSSAATRQSNSTGRLTLIISLSAPSRSPGLIACRPTQPNASASLTKSGSASE